MATYAVGTRFGTRIAVAAALLTATSPVFLNYYLQPLNDVAVAALWMIALALGTGARPRDALWSGAACGAAIPLQPRLAWIAMGIALFDLLRPEWTKHQRLRTAAIYAGALAVGYVVMATLQHVVSPYVQESMPPRWFPIDLEREFRLLTVMNLVIAGLALFAPLLLPGRLTILFLGLFTADVALHAYAAGWYSVRNFPTLPLAFVLGAAVIDAMWWQSVRRGVG